jgi:N-acetylglucosamine-6-phosphate deacetylase
MLLSNARICSSEFEIVDADLAIGDGRIRQVLPRGSGEGGLDLSGLLVLPGFIDQHVHGCAGADTCDDNPEALKIMSAYLASQGVTSFCAATMTIPFSRIEKILENARLFQTMDFAGASLAGVHLEGPYLSAGRSGVQNPDFIRKPDFEEFKLLIDRFPGLVRIVDVAPETVGASEFIRKASALCTVSLSHSVADYERARESFSEGITQVTHLFNAMTCINHRAPGAAVAVFDDSQVKAEIICDGLHVHPAVLRMAFSLLGENRTVIISDAMRAAGRPDGEYLLGDQTIRVMNGRTYFGDGRMAGSTTSIHKEIKNLLSYGIPFGQVIRSATINPAVQIGMDSETGSIAEGKYADLTVVDTEMNIRRVFVHGREVFSAM